jgi:tetratricopeptide (TPR) repeat protein
MRNGLTRALVVAIAGVWLAGCNTNGSFSDLVGAKSSTASNDAFASASPSDVKDDPPLPKAGETVDPQLYGSNPGDDINVAKKQYRAQNYGNAEKYFRRAVESHPRDAEAWLGLAASYDQLRRFDLADRAYNQAIGILGPTAEVLNNQGYSYMLRGDYKRAHEKLIAAQRLDPRNKFVANNLRLLEASARTGKAIE